MSAPTTPPPAAPAPLPKLAKTTRTKIDGAPGAWLTGGNLAVGGALLGYVAIVLAWGITELAGVADARSLGPVAFYTAVLGAVYAIVISAASDLREGIVGRALIRGTVGAFVGLAVGAIAGAVSQVLFDQLQQTQDPGAIRFYFLRAVSWAVFGIGIGLIGGITERSTRKAVNGLVGGLLGGLIGGALFHLVGMHVESASSARLVGLALVGASVGAAIGVVEAARRIAWVRVTAGGLTGKEFPLHHDVTTVGASPKCHVTIIKDPKIQPFHLQIAIDGPRRVVSSLEDSPLSVNGRTARAQPLRTGDLIQIGATTLQYHERD